MCYSTSYLTVASTLIQTEHMLLSILYDVCCIVRLISRNYITVHALLIIFALVCVRVFSTLAFLQQGSLVV